MMNKILILAFFLCIKASFAQNYSLLNSVMAWAEVNSQSNSLNLKWKKQTDDSSFTIYRKLKDEKTWPILPIATLPASANQFSDTTVKVGKAYEYRIRRKAGSIFSESYLYGGIKVEAVALKKTILLLVDARIKSGIETELNTLKEDLANETWSVKVLEVPQTKTALEVKDMIWEEYDKDPNITTIFIIGHVAVPYSGNTRWDGHSDHEGAWVCDNFYADINGFWTDEFVNNTTPARPENKNIIGDEKWDNDLIPSDLEFEVGRVDFFNMPAFTKSEIQLLKSYLNKDHLHRIAKTRAVRRAIVQDNFNFAGEYFGSSGYKNYTVLVGPDSVKSEAFRDRLLQQSYLLAYGSGGGWYQGAGGISSTPDMAKDSLQGVFTFLFGSYFGDWDVQNNFLRSALGSGSILTCAWAGRPSWYIQHMSMGETIGYSTFITNNHQTIYKGNPLFSPYRPAHVSLLGDPSLTLLPVIPPTSLMVTESSGNVNLQWTASTEATEGYSVMRRTLPSGKFEIISNNVKTTMYSDKCLSENTSYEYLVAAIKLETNASGTFYNRSAGIRASILVKNSGRTKANFNYIADYEFITFKATSKNAKSHTWKVLGKDLTGDSITVEFPCYTQGTVTLIATGDCNTDQLSETVFDFICSVPELIKTRTVPEIKCAGDVTDIYLDTIIGADPFTFKWSNGSTTNPVIGVSGTLMVEITSRKGTKKSFEVKLPKFDALVINTIQVKNVNAGFNLGKVTDVMAIGGVPPYTYKVLNVVNQDSLPVGMYTLELTDANGCKTTKAFEIKMNVATNNPNSSAVNIYPNPTSNELYLESEHEIRSVKIYNLKGEEMGFKKIENIDKNLYILNVQELIPGYYHVQINNDNKKIGFVKK
ncbi:MAG: T9SS type A sorting domain-containing protein [Saprospiraceae bacterium]|nr:T9SS type A sorting domain-containing protein [Saprospiraceae bacterium]